MPSEKVNHERNLLKHGMKAHGAIDSVFPPVEESIGSSYYTCTFHPVEVLGSCIDFSVILSMYLHNDGTALDDTYCMG